MAIHQPGRRLLHGITLKFVSDHVSGGGKRNINAGLSLTSMIDFLIVVVVFLLMTFNSAGETPLSKNVRLPKAENSVDMVDAPLVGVVGGQILVDGASTGHTREIEESKQVKRIEELFNVLKAKRELWKQTRPGKEFPGVVVLQIDRDVPAVVVKSVFQTSAFAGYPNVSFMVDGAPKTKG